MIRKILVSILILVVFMAGLSLSAVDFHATLIRKIFTPEVSQPTPEQIRRLPAGLQDIVILALSEGQEPGKREGRIRAELIAKGETAILERLPFADALLDLSSVEVSGGWKWRTLADAYRPLPPLRWLLRGVISRPSVTIFFGAPKGFKSMLITEAALCVCHGLPWLKTRGGNGGFGVAKSPVAWIDLENGERRMNERLSAFGLERDVPETADFRYVVMPTPWPDASGPGFVGNLMATLHDFGAGLLVIDHLSQVLGDIDENTSGMSQVMANLRGMAESMDLGLILLHHQVKSASRFGITSSDSLRGHGSILANCDLAAVVERQVTQREAVTVRPVAVRGPDLDPFGALFTFEHKADGSKELQRARFFGQEAANMDLDIELSVYDVLRESPGINQTALRALVADLVGGAGDTAIRDVIARLETSKKIVFEQGKQRAKLYRLAKEA